ncbi:MAG: DUF488 domain-containing protein [Anaerolineae bacterium]|nr:DUF488 domain-containing protein [Anaerolineae bacterium]
MSLYSIGYEAVNEKDFIICLKQYKINTVIDVRQNPISREPGFSRIRLQLALMISDIKYEHLLQFGCPTFIRDTYKKNQNWEQYAQEFNLYLKSLQSEVASLATRASHENIALMCFEANHNYCHRSLICAEITKRFNMPATHIMVQSQEKVAARYQRLLSV